MEDDKKITVDFTEFPELYENLKYFSRREAISLDSALIRILAIAVESNFNLGYGEGDPWPFLNKKSKLFGD